LAQVLKKDPNLQSLSDTEKLVFFELWSERGDLEELVRSVQENPDWTRYAWLGIAKYNASKKDFRSAYEMIQRFGDAVALPRIPPGASLEETLERGRLGTELWLPLALAALALAAPEEDVAGVAAASVKVPDVAADASPSSGYLIFSAGSSVTVGGTSGAAPLWAGFATLQNQHHGGALGNLNPTFYSIGNGTSYSTGFHDVTTGNNTLHGTTGFTAATGYDQVTGWGSFKGSGLSGLIG